MKPNAATLPQLEYNDNLPPEAPGGKAAFDLFLISALGLFLEILLIRWLSAEIRLFAYLQNFTLLACFLGLGIGFALARSRTSWYTLFLPILWVYIGLIVLFTYLKLTQYIYNPDTTQFFTWESRYVTHAVARAFVFYGTATFFFLLTAMVFIPLGQLTGRLMLLFSPLKAYTINIFGSLIGIWAFSLICFLGAPPPLWMALAVLGALWFLRRDKRAVIISLLISSLLIFLIYRVDSGSLWSPYYRILIERIDIEKAAPSKETLRIGYNLTVNHDYHQRILNLNPKFVAEHEADSPLIAQSAWAYALPYKINVHTPGDVLVVGAGTGNDVAAALRNGARTVSAVEIDPLILKLGRDRHPERPYQDAKVSLFNDDARSFLKRTPQKYDLIVYGLLDSHTLLSRMSGLRLDSYIYTIESFRDARAHLKENGTLALSFSIGKGYTWLGYRIHSMLKAAFDRDPICVPTEYDGGFLFMVGENPNYNLPKGVTLVNTGIQGFIPASDDWPFLYLMERSIPKVYWIMMVMVLVISVSLIRLAFPAAGKLNLHFFFLGSAFLLIEVKGITELSLIFGSTWLVNSVVISAILGMILLANLYISRKPHVNINVHYALLATTLLLGYLAPPSRLLSQYPLLTKVAATLLVSLPLFFSGIIFAASLKGEANIGQAFGSNLLGAMVGGLCEYSSLILGFKTLYLLALVLYLLSYLKLSISKVDATKAPN